MFTTQTFFYTTAGCTHVIYVLPKSCNLIGRATYTVLLQLKKQQFIRLSPTRKRLASQDNEKCTLFTF